jgi:hypothetical protein
MKPGRESAIINDVNTAIEAAQNPSSMPASSPATEQNPLRFEYAPDDALIDVPELVHSDTQVVAYTLDELAIAIDYACEVLGEPLRAYSTAAIVRHEGRHATAAKAAGAGSHFAAEFGRNPKTQKTRLEGAQFCFAACSISKIALASVAIHPPDFSKSDRSVIELLGYQTVSEVDQSIVAYNALHGTHLLRPTWRARLYDRLSGKQHATD